MRAVNLIPSDERLGGAAAGRSEGAAYIVLALLAGLAILALLYGISRHQVSSRRSQLASITARTEQAQQAASSLHAYTSFMSLRQQRIQAVEQLVDARFDWAHTLHELGRVLPADASITSLSGSVGSPTSSTSSSSSTAGAAVSSATPPGSVPTFTLGGCATSQAEVALTLQRLRLIDGVGNVALQSSTRTAGASSASNSCGAHTAFNVTLTFDALPSAPASGKGATQLTASSGGGQ